MHLNRITSSENPLIKEVRLLKNKKYRDEKALFFIEGVKLVEEALKEQARVKTLFISEQFAASNEVQGILSGKHKNRPPASDILTYKTYVLPDKLFGDISDTETPQGILAVVNIQKHDLAEIHDEKNLFVILESLQDPGNMGTIIRTADAAGFSGVIVCRGCVDIYNPKVLRSTMGSIFHIPIIPCDEPAEAIKMLKSRGINVYGAHLAGTASFYELNLKHNCALVIGNESKGISNDTAAAADLLVKIPMPGKAESLNASVAAGLLMYESVRQRTIKKI